ncbi:glycogen/starch/alpha-glucan phosphorylase [Phenylobacterium soli]|uniref:Alpha-1,4 glucan phosphorylase n=1 Tax=Phenylobacterium soli TaxID=2170551 RepID=A0A328AJK5_9CAUL|nr:glycogen/starch/alpha-glucan phosphorylase [Phenylobacterium soli]RAK54980.1 glycogen phosphorylase [Phenylobacterium soli]
MSASSDVAVRIALPTEDQDVAALRRAIVAKLAYSVGKDPIVATEHDWFMATALAVRDRIVDAWFPTTRTIYTEKPKRVYYLSVEFLIGRLLYDSLNALGLAETMRKALAELGVDLEVLREVEPDAALGNGGLGRLAACFMESMASLGIAGYGYGIRYDHGMFRQKIKDGWQSELPETWLAGGNPWEFERPDVVYHISYGGSVEARETPEGEIRHIWHPAETVEAVAYDTPMVGWRGKHVNTLRLWSARAPDPLRLDAFNRGDHLGALASQSRAQAISQVLYPADDSPAGQELRLRQEHFFSSAALQDIVRRHLHQHGDLKTLPDHVAIQLNDTHPAISIAEMMRLLIDNHGVEWDDAWDVCRRTFNYTNHTLLPEALEHWPVPLMERMLPRHMQIIYLINARHLDELRAKGALSEAEIGAVSLIEESGARQVRMGWLSFIGSHRVNGVSALHTDLMRQTVFAPLHRLYPDRIVNKTNGITFRRWLMEANPGLTQLLADTVGSAVLDNTERLADFAAYADDAGVQERFRAIRREHKAQLSGLIHRRLGVKVDPDAMFDTHIKRIHEYKRQLLNILETVALYDAMRAQPTRNWTPRVKIFAGKAAASYQNAKLVIKLINDVANVVNNDPTLRGLLKVVFLPNYNVSLAEAVIPASDLSEQISTAGMEASGTGNMKFALNGALTIGTLDGANVEIKDRVGDDNIFIFGLEAHEVEQRRREGFGTEEIIRRSPMIQQVLDQIGSGGFSPAEPNLYSHILDGLVRHDHFLVLGDFQSYAEKQREVAAKWRDPAAWWRSAILNTAHMGFFSSDRTIRDYAEEIWGVPVKPA